jgi:hypothetical protein
MILAPVIDSITAHRLAMDLLDAASQPSERVDVGRYGELQRCEVPIARRPLYERASEVVP